MPHAHRHPHSHLATTVAHVADFIINFHKKMCVCVEFMQHLTDRWAAGEAAAAAGGADRLDLGMDPIHW